jgi:rRNA maturation endonuclease Nob1
LTNFEIGFYIVVLASSAILFFGLTLKDYTTPSFTTVVNKKKIFCTNCGHEYSSESAGEFCEYCGSKL